MNQSKTHTFATRAVHAGEGLSGGEIRPVVSPIHPSVGFLAENMQAMDAIFAGEQPGYVYPRYGSPTLTALETAVANLEGAGEAQAFASGMAALHATLLAAGVAAGKTVVAAVDLYGATYTLLNTLFLTLGVSVHWVDVCDLTAVEAALAASDSTALLVETISNPLLKVADVPRLAELAHHYGAQLLVDNTFASPYLFNPLTHGADYVIHSATKYLAGHGDVMAGVVATSKPNRIKLYEISKLIGGILGPFEAWLTLRGLKTLPLRLLQQFSNALEIAEWIAGQPQIEAVYFPGLAAHPQHVLAQRLFGGRGFGGILSFEIAGAGQAEAFRFMNALRLCQPATTLGDIYTLVLHPPTSSHRSLTAAERKKIGISDGVIRLSAGIEDAGDLISDLQQALTFLA